MRVRLFAVLALSLAVSPLPAQHGDGQGAAVSTTPVEARQFDFLIGQWELEVRPAVSGLAARLHGAPKFGGSWKAWRAFDGWGIEDELRILDTRGSLRTIAHTLRVYDQTAAHWSQTTLDVFRARFNPGNPMWSGKEMVSSAPATDADGKAHLVRVRFFAITATGFRYEQARSYDNGTTWQDPVLKITAKRTATTAAR